MYHVGSSSESQAWKDGAWKPGAHTMLDPAESDDSKAADEAVDVEQRHDVQAAVVGGQLQ